MLKKENGKEGQKKLQNEQPVNPELQREEDEKRTEMGKKDFHDVGGFPRPPLSGGIV
ncbi:hypothetical protein [Hespellia stercorisuis]|uniref:Uncharacterized protein n=1 Tax=Hespellia stercorisuis DSM 15480 TaxID=1121950 RepID=A0A1M6U674_9FIRM|nr:hypothetical protein [Hespellia stercorisuis]SHK64785.1 hypothetical protein SAMN02745243_03419 [Hespellia stercorisuis DSM 15480]